MKKYIKPSIEIVEADLSADCLQGSYDSIGVYGGTGADGSGYIDPTGIGGDGVSGGDGNYGQWAPGKKGSNDEDFGW